MNYLTTPELAVFKRCIRWVRYRIYFSLISGSVYTSGTGHIIPSTKHQTSGSQLGLAQNGVVGVVFGIVRRKEMSFVVLLVRLGLVGFSRVCRVSRVSMVMVGIRVSFSDRVGIGLPDVDWVELHIGFPTCKHRLIFKLWHKRPSQGNSLFIVETNNVVL